MSKCRKLTTLKINLPRFSPTGNLERDISEEFGFCYSYPMALRVPWRNGGSNIFAVSMDVVCGMFKFDLRFVEYESTTKDIF